MQEKTSPAAEEIIYASIPILGIRKYIAVIFMKDAARLFKNIKVCLPIPFNMPLSVIFVYIRGQRKASFLSKLPSSGR